MALLGNGTLAHKIPGRFLGGATLAPERANFNKTSAERNSFVGGIPPIGSTPNGYTWPYAWVNAAKDGAVSSYNLVGGTASVAAQLTAARLSSATLSGSGEVASASLAVLTQLAALAAGAGEITDAEVAAVSRMTAALSAAGTVEAQISAIIPVLAALSGSGSISPNLTGRARLEADIQPFTELSPQALAQAVLDGNDIETGYSLREAMRLVLAAMAGKISGAGGSTITIRDINDLRDRIVATVDASGNRTAIAHDVED